MCASSYTSSNRAASTFFAKVRQATGVDWLEVGRIPDLGDVRVQSVVTEMGVPNLENVVTVSTKDDKSSYKIALDKTHRSVMCLARVHFAFTIGIQGSLANYSTVSVVEYNKEHGEKTPPFILALSSFAPLLDVEAKWDPPVYGMVNVLPLGPPGLHFIVLTCTSQVLLLFTAGNKTRPLILAASEPKPSTVAPAIKLADIAIWPGNFLTKVPASSGGGNYYTEPSSFSKAPRYLIALHLDKKAAQSAQSKQQQVPEGMVAVETTIEVLYVKPGGVFFRTAMGASNWWCYSEPMEENGKPGAIVWLSAEAAGRLIAKLRQMAEEQDRPANELFLCVKKVNR